MDISRPDSKPKNSNNHEKGQSMKQTKNRHEYERVKLHLHITPKQYQGMHLLGNFQQQNKWTQKQKE